MRPAASARLAAVAFLVGICLSSIAVGAGASSAPACSGRPATIVGTSGSDRLVGTGGSDIIVGLAGDDFISGLGGDDRICGNRGADSLRGGDGDDVLLGDRGADLVAGGRGGDRLSGRGSTYDGAARDELRGGPGPDKINFHYSMEDPYYIPTSDNGHDPTFGGRGADWIGVCPDGQRSISGGAGRDTAVFCSEVVADLGREVSTFASGASVRLLGIENLLGAPGRDRLVADEGPNVLYAGYDLDEVFDPPADELVGRGGNDLLQASPGDLVIEGGDGDDTFGTWCCNGDQRPITYRFDGGSGDDTMEACVHQGNMRVHFVLLGGEGSDTAAFCFRATASLAAQSGSQYGGSAMASFRSIENLRGSHQDDRLVGDANDNTIWAGDGNDNVDAGAGTDLIDGGDGVDVCLNGETMRRCP